MSPELLAGIGSIALVIWLSVVELRLRRLGASHLELSRSFNQSLDREIHRLRREELELITATAALRAARERLEDGG